MRDRRVNGRLVSVLFYFQPCARTKKRLNLASSGFAVMGAAHRINCSSASCFKEVTMPESRRRLLTALMGAIGVFAVEPLLAGLQGPGTPPKAKVYPNGRDPNRNTMDEPSHLDPKAIARANQLEIRTDITKLS